MTDKQFSDIMVVLTRIEEKLTDIKGGMWDGIEVIITACIIIAIAKGC
jgi:hypothetical protein